MGTPIHNEILHFGTWTTDAAGLPCFDLRLPDDEALDAPFRHLISSGHLWDPLESTCRHASLSIL